MSWKNGQIYTPEMVNFLKENFKDGMCVRAITVKFNERFNENKSVSSLWSAMNRRGILKKADKSNGIVQKHYNANMLSFNKSDLEIGHTYRVFYVGSNFISHKTSVEFAGKYKLLEIYSNYLLFENIASGRKECFINNTKLVRLKG